MTKFVVTEKGILGVISKNPFGWRFIPWVQRSPSRLNWPTPESAMPRWAKASRIIEASSPQEAMRLYAAESSTTLAGKVCALSYRFGFDSPEANTLSEAAEQLRKP